MKNSGLIAALICSLLSWTVSGGVQADAAAKWIKGSYVPPAATNVAAFFVETPNDIVRKSFMVPEGRIRKAELKVASPGMRDIRLNGQLVTPTALPPFTPYNHRILEENFDLSVWIKPGVENVLEIELGNGWWNLLPYVFWYGIDIRGSLPQGAPCVRATLEIEMCDGGRQLIATDSSWQAASGRIVRNSIYTGVTEDARRTVVEWRPATIAEGPKGKVVAVECRADRRLPKTEVIQRWPAKSVTKLANGDWVVDFGVNFAGTYRARLRGLAQGAKVRITSGERLFDDGKVNYLTAVAGQIKKPEKNPLFGVAKQCDEYVAGDESEALFEPRFTFHAFRYLQVEGLPTPPSRDDFEALAWSAAVADAGAFECSVAMLNQLHEVAQRTFRANLQGGVQSDCPGREKFGYGGDIAVVAESFRANYAMAPLYRKIVRDFVDEAADDGLITETAPYVGIGSSPVVPVEAAGGRHVAPMGWTLGLPVMLDLLVRYDGDMEILGEAYPTLVRYIDIVAKRYPDNRIPTCLGDWIALEKSDTTLSALASWHEFVRYTLKFAELLRKDGDIPRLTALKREIAKAFRERYVHTGGKVNRGFQGEQLYALQGGLLSDEQGAAYALFKRNLADKDYKFTTGIATLSYLFEQLGARGDAEIAGKCLLYGGNHGFRHLLKLGATTLWESFSLEACLDRYSNCHPMFGSYEAFFTRYILGIRVTDDAVGGNRVIIKPHPVAGVTWARGHLDVALGRIEVSWYLKDGEIQLNVRLPPGVTRLP